LITSGGCYAQWAGARSDRRDEPENGTSRSSSIGSKSIGRVSKKSPMVERGAGVPGRKRLVDGAIGAPYVESLRANAHTGTAHPSPPKGLRDRRFDYQPPAAPRPVVLAAASRGQCRCRQGAGLPQPIGPAGAGSRVVDLGSPASASIPQDPILCTVSPSIPFGVAATLCARTQPHGVRMELAQDQSAGQSRTEGCTGTGPPSPRARAATPTSSQPAVVIH
jgi:hypothetical protein